MVTTLRCTNCKKIIERLTVNAACENGVGALSFCCPECDTVFVEFDVQCDSVGAFRRTYRKAASQHNSKLIPLIVTGRRKALVAAGIFGYISPMVEQQFFSKGGDSSGNEKAQNDQAQDS